MVHAMRSKDLVCLLKADLATAYASRWHNGDGLGTE